MDETQRRLDDLTSRVQALEDELAIHRLIVSYGLAVDIGDPERSAGVFTPDGVYDVDVGLMEGRDAVKAMVRGARHQEMVGHCAHQIGPAVVRVDGDCATATGYSRVYLQTRAGTHIYRISFNRWELAKQNGQWLITRRTTRLLGTDEAKEIFRNALG